jgi:hypothetical protein
VIQSHLRDDGEGFSLQDVGRIVSAAHPNFDDADLDVLAGEDIEGGGSKELKLGSLNVFGFVAFQHLGFNFAEDGFGYGFLVDTDAVPSREGSEMYRRVEVGDVLPVNQMRRSEAACGDSASMEEGGEVCTHCAFAICPRNVNGLPWLRVVPEQLRCPLQPELYHPKGVNLDRMDGAGRKYCVGESMLCFVVDVVGSKCSTLQCIGCDWWCVGYVYMSLQLPSREFRVDLPAHRHICTPAHLQALTETTIRIHTAPTSTASIRTPKAVAFVYTVAPTTSIASSRAPPLSPWVSRKFYHVPALLCSRARQRAFCLHIATRDRKREPKKECSQLTQLSRVWQPSSPDVQKNATSRDPTASSRSAIRRRRSAEIGSSSSSSSAAAWTSTTSRVQISQERQDTLNGLLESSRRRASELVRLADASQLRASELREARQNLRRPRATDGEQTGEDAQGLRDIDRYSRRPRPSDYLQRRIDRLPDLSRELPTPSDSLSTRMLVQTRELRNQISQLRETIQRHQVHDARVRARAAPWLEPDQQLHSDDPASPISALHNLRLPLSSLTTLLREVESEFRDPTPRDVEEQFRVSVRARYAENPLENPHHDAPRLGWDEEMIADFWDAELYRRLHPEFESTPIGAAAQQVYAMRPSSPPVPSESGGAQAASSATAPAWPSHSDRDAETRRIEYWGPLRTDRRRRRDSLSPSTSTSSGGPVSASLSAPRRNWYLPESVAALQQRRDARIRSNREQTEWSHWAANADGPTLSPTFPLHSDSYLGPSFRHEAYSRYAPSAPRLVHSPPSYISAGEIDGLGDRELSIGPGETEDEAWEVMQSTVAPDRALPSADSSFTSAAASASFSASRSHSAESSVPTSFVDEDEWDREGECL